jgi:hypothetical protein
MNQLASLNLRYLGFVWCLQLVTELQTLFLHPDLCIAVSSKHIAFQVFPGQHQIHGSCLFIINTISERDALLELGTIEAEVGIFCFSTFL